MNYEGKLYGHLGGKKYFDTGKTALDWDKLENKIAELENELAMLRKDDVLPLPVLGQKYHYFDDGKISVSRRMEVVITDIIPFNEIDQDTLDYWQLNIEECDWLFAKETNLFLKADLTVSENSIAKIIFVRTINDGWFSLGWWAGRLNLDGSLNKLIEDK